MSALSMTDWQSPDTTPDVSTGSYDWFWVAVERHGRVVSLPATYLNAMPLDRDDTDPIESPESGNHWRNEPPGEHDECVMLATGWHESREHADYAGFYAPLLDDKATLVAWKAVASWTKDRQPSAGTGDAVRTIEVLEAIGSAFAGVPAPCEERDAIAAAVAALSAGPAAPVAPDVTDDLDFEPDEHHTIADMANVGYSLMQAIKSNCPDYCWGESPAEIVVDLINQRDEAAGTVPGASKVAVPVAVVPEGYALVPTTPNDDMVIAFAEQWYSKARPIDDCELADAYAAMLAATPVPAAPATGEGT